MNIKQWQEELHENAVKHGWWEKQEADHIPEKLCLVHAEVSEALEAFRVNNWKLFKEELADIMIRVMDLAENFDINLETEIYIKHEYNKKRSYRHGNKRC